jgi:hypothetical protein
VCEIEIVREEREGKGKEGECVCWREAAKGGRESVCEGVCVCSCIRRGRVCTEGRERGQGRERW